MPLKLSIGHYSGNSMCEALTVTGTMDPETTRPVAVVFGINTRKPTYFCGGYFYVDLTQCSPAENCYRGTLTGTTSQHVPTKAPGGLGPAACGQQS